MTTTSSILLLQGDAEASLLADGEVALQAVFPDADVQFIRTWATRPDWLADDAAAPPAFLADGAAGPQDVRALLAQPHRLVVQPDVISVRTEVHMLAILQGNHHQ